ncbi:doublesex- and mab-3-related transcription factor 1Y-like [Antennarius striatus]|uniref:doublesex- and mab-3-related transcription factor 1Y-like n=1 Tax=Antennarius striatus TaxID=241820 RepID=UPI0035B433D8
MAAQVALRRQQAQEEELGICSPAVPFPEVMVKDEGGAECLFSSEGRSVTPNFNPSLAVSGSRSVPSSSLSAGGWGLPDGPDLLLETSYYNLYQSSRYPAYYGNLYNYQQYQVPHGDGRLPSHNMPPQYHMHSCYPAATYLTQGLGTSACMQPVFSLEDNNNNCTETVAACFLPSSNITGHESMTCRSTSSPVNSHVHADCEVSSETPSFTVSSIMDGDTTK